ncbi:hypothetical protein [Enterococcus casseliflavus]|uniref:hypothetical protein n=1 Tax=Enterococcus casseliflavus TaxID=37734 RepID=UPI0030190EEA
MIKRFFYRLSDGWYYSAKEDLIYAFFAFIDAILGYTFLTHRKINVDFKLIGDLLGLVIEPIMLGKILLMTSALFGVLIFIKPTRKIKYCLSIVASLITFAFFFLYGVTTEIVLSGFMESSILLTIGFISLTLCGMEVMRLCQMTIQKKD